MDANRPHISASPRRAEHCRPAKKARASRNEQSEVKAAENTSARILVQSLGERVALLECCPASLLKRVHSGRLYKPYKGKEAVYHNQRAIILRSAQLGFDGLKLELPPDVAKCATADPGGDALDAVLAAACAALASMSPNFPAPSCGWHAEFSDEACVYC